MKYAEYPDKDIVRVALTDARKQCYGALVDGRAGEKRGLSAKTGRVPSEDGWLLTTAGVEWIRKNLQNLDKLATSGDIKEHRQKVLKQLKRVRGHTLFEQYLRSADVFRPMIGDIADLVRCRVDAEPEVWQARFDKIRRRAESAGQNDVLDFIARCERAYAEQR